MAKKKAPVKVESEESEGEIYDSEESSQEEEDENEGGSEVEEESEEAEEESEEEDENEEVEEAEPEEAEESEEEESEEEAPPPKKKAPRKKAPAKKAPAKKKAAAPAKKVDPKRHFKILLDTIKPDSDKTLEPQLQKPGRYAGKNPMQAAKKAFTRICRSTGEKGEAVYIFSIQEMTQGSAKKVFTYRGTRKKLEKPQEITKGDTSYNVHYSSDVKSYKPDKVTKAPAKKAATKKAPAKKAPAKKAPAKKKVVRKKKKTTK